MSGVNERMGTEKVGKLLFQLAIPSVLAQVVNLLYSIVDRIYVGRIPGYGSLALAGLGVTFPIVVLITAFANLVGMGGAPRASIAMGRGDYKGAEKILGNCVTMLIAFSFILMTVFLLFKDGILLTFGASEKTLPYADSYISIYLIGTIFVQLALGLNTFITNQGFSKTSMATVCIGALLNIILDPIFIFVFQMGVKGAAIATVISQAVSAIWVICFLNGKKTGLKIHIKYLRPEKAVIFAICSLGISPFIMSATECLIQLTFNTGMQKYGNDMYVALMSILFSLIQLVFMPIAGFAAGGQPIISYNYGAKKYDRVKSACKLLFYVMLGFSLIFVALIELFPGVFIGMFTPDSQMIAAGIPVLRIYMFGMAVMGAQNACQQSFLALGEAKISVCMALLRKVILLIPLALILPKIAGLGIIGLMLSEPISDIISAVTTTFMFGRRSRVLLKETT